ncbi:unnamed protein product [Parnassius apollo]|uniref:(apollo) hypothetical protein n=1 Tax=Parnassius apollo TaxID=110799 RepID=A0A8S3X4M4_PARAO|nr:unnamed protein product [Parnassius apollo]
MLQIRHNRPRIVRTVRMAFAGTNVSLSQPDITQKLTERIDDLKQRIAAWGKRIRRYTESSTRFNQNRLFQSDQKRLYESLERPMVSETGPAPNQADTVAFWRGLWLTTLWFTGSEARKPQRGPLDGSCGESVCGYYAHGPRHHNAG